MMIVKNTSKLAVLLTIAILLFGAPVHGLANIYYENNYQTKYVLSINPDGSESLARFDVRKVRTKWSRDNIFNNTTYTYSDKSTHTVTERFEPTITKSISGITQTTTTRFGNPRARARTKKEVGKLIQGSVRYSTDYSQKIGEYIFSDGTKIEGYSNRRGVKTTWGGDKSTKITRHTFADRSSFTTSEWIAPQIINSVSGLVQTKKIVHAKPRSSVITVRETARPITNSETLSNDFLTKTVAYGFNDGSKTYITFNRISHSTTWSSDNITRYTTHLYTDGARNTVTDRVEPMTLIRWADDNVTKTTTLVYGNGARSNFIEIVNPVNNVYWSADNITKTINRRYGNGFQEQIIMEVQPTQLISWAPDNVTRITEKIYGNGVREILTHNIPPVEEVRWSLDKTLKYITTIYANGVIQHRTEIISFLDSTPSFTAAIYPNGWTTNEGVSVTPPRVSAIIRFYSDGSSQTIESGTSILPFNQSTLITSNITDANAFVKTNNDIYDLRWGVVDRQGPGIASELRSYGSSYRYIEPLNIAGYSVSDACGYTYYTPTTGCGGPIFLRPAEDVLNAWSQGWTGLGSNILIIDSFGSNINSKTDGDDHGIVVSAIAKTTAINATVLSLDWGFAGPIKEILSTPKSNKKLHAINLSFDYIYDTDQTRAYAADIVQRLNSGNLLAYTGFSSSDAVFIKAAGNDSKDLTQRGGVTALSAELINNSNTISKTLLVGALDKDGTVSNRANIASYSNRPGADVRYQKRFLLANGNTIFGNDFAIDRLVLNGSSNDKGTSYAAPRVAAYAAILRQKYPNLNAEKSSSILLDTARTDTLWCHPTCLPSVIGKGEASLSRALAPIGRLR
jgi:hypothetical protein